MRTILFFAILLFVWSCKEETQKTKVAVDVTARNLNDSAVVLATQQQYDKAVVLLDEAIKIDSNYFTAYINKLNFQSSIKPFDKEKIAVILKKLSSLKPADPQYPMKLGMLYLKSPDTIPSTFYLKEAVKKFDRILDTMQSSNREHDLTVINKAAAIILLGDEEKGRLMMMQVLLATKNETIQRLLPAELRKSRKEMIASIKFE